MNTGTPYIGSKISLVSKAEIRYEGILYQVDTKEATVTLASGKLTERLLSCCELSAFPFPRVVRSFGTENRPAQKPIPPRKETYQYIIFRGSDIKDLHVSAEKEPEGKTEEVPQDPAILSAVSRPVWGLWLCIGCALIRKTLCLPMSVHYLEILPKGALTTRA